MERGKRPINAIGVLFYAQDTGRVLYLLRNQREQTWALPGGKIERGESLKEALVRECREEVGGWPDLNKLIPIDCYRSGDDKFIYHTFFCLVPREFLPTLNDEHIAYCWAELGSYPKPLHNGLHRTITQSVIQQKISMILDTLK
jgi:8-oxo-dGTP pyrophosphatase MutT (NUDIX family)